VWATTKIKDRRKAIQRQLRPLARRAVELVERADPTGGTDAGLVAGLRALAADETGKPRSARSADPASAAPQDDLVTLCEELAGQDRDTVEARVRFLSGLDAVSLRTYLPVGSDRTAVASQLVAAVTDLPPEWIFDCATQRRLKVPFPGTPGVADAEAQPEAREQPS
jgi:hypothetical protein